MVLTSVLGLAAPSAFAQTDEERAGARSMAQQGAEAFQQERWQDAVDLFSRAQSLVEAPPHLLYIARAQEKLGKLVEAQEAYIKVTRSQLAADAPPAFRDAQLSAAEELAALKPRVPQVTVLVKGEGAELAEVQVDGNPIPSAFIGVQRPTDPGERVYTAKSPTGNAEPMTISLAEGVIETVELNLVPSVTAAPVAAAPPPTTPTGTNDSPPADTGTSGSGYTIPMITAFGVGGVGLIAGTIFLVQRSGAQSDADSLWDNCRSSGDCNQSDADEIQKLDDDAASAGTLSTVGFAVGVAGLGAGIALWLLDSGEPQTASRTSEPSLSPWVGTDQVGVMGRF